MAKLNASGNAAPRACGCRLLVAGMLVIYQMGVVAAQAPAGARGAGTLGGAVLSQSTVQTPAPTPGLSGTAPADFDPTQFGEITSSTLSLEDGERVVMRINGERITWDDFITQVRLAGSTLYEAHPGLEASIAAAMAKPVEEALVLQGLYREFARKNRLEPEAREIQKATGAALSGQGGGKMRSALRLLTPDQITQLITDNLTREKVDKFLGDRATSAPPTAAELTSFTETFKPPVSAQVTLRARHIVLRATPDMSEFNINDAKAKAEDIRSRLEDAVTTNSVPGQIALDFPTAARQFSQDRFTAYRGGDLGYFKAGTMYPAVNEALEKLEPGQVSPVVRSAVGFHIFQLTERHPDDLRLHYDRWRREHAVVEWKTKAGAAAKITNYLEQ